MSRITDISLTGIGFSFSAEIDRRLFISAKWGTNFSSTIFSNKGRSATSSSSGFINDIIYFRYYVTNAVPVFKSVIAKNNRKGYNEKYCQI